MSEHCPQQGKWFGCKFEPRYSQKLADIDVHNVSAVFLEDVLEAAKLQIYEGDVCVRCGKTVNMRKRDESRSDDQASENKMD